MRERERERESDIFALRAQYLPFKVKVMDLQLTWLQRGDFATSS
jgi:hypothetical protein